MEAKKEPGFCRDRGLYGLGNDRYYGSHGRRQPELQSPHSAKHNKILVRACVGDSSLIQSFQSRAQVPKTTTEVNLHRRRRSGFLLPDDIIFDVLTRLPAKVLCRFRCVCKGWRALLSDQAFIAAHKSRAAPLIAGVFRSLRMGHKLELRVMDMDGGSILRVFKNMPRFLAPTRLDLICVYDVPGDFATIVDPAAGRVVLIGGHNLGINTSTLSYSYYSFGRAAPSGVYKVLRVDVAFDGRVQLCEIATIDDDCGSEPAWRERHVPSAITHWYDEEEAKVNGILYFMSCVDDDTPQDCYSIACFDLESEDWTKMIDGPAMGLGKDEKTYWVALAELKGTLNMVQTVYYPSSNLERYVFYINIWLLIDSKKSSWVKQHMIHMPENVHPAKVLDFLSDGRILLLNEKRDQNRSSYRYILQFYNPSEEAFTDVMELPDEFVGAIALYTGSLLS